MVLDRKSQNLYSSCAYLINSSNALRNKSHFWDGRYRAEGALRNLQTVRIVTPIKHKPRISIKRIYSSKSNLFTVHDKGVTAIEKYTYWYLNVRHDPGHVMHMSY